MFACLTGVIINAIFIIVGSLLGMILKKGIPDKLTEGITNATGLCVLFIGISGTMKTIVSAEGEVIGANTLVVIASMVFGTALGTVIGIDNGLNRFGKAIENKINNGPNKTGGFAKGFVNATLLFGIGAMAITGPIESALMNDHSTLIAKGVIDGITAIIFASSMGWLGVVCSAAPIFVYEGGIAVIARLAGASFMSDSMNVQLIVTGSLLITAIGLNMLHITKIKVADMLPAVFIAPLQDWIISLF